MGVPPYTRIDIITEGLSQAGRVDLTSNGRKWLNLFLDKVYCQYDWDFLKRYSGIISLSQNMPYLTSTGSPVGNFRKMANSATLYVSQPNPSFPYVAQRELPTMIADEYAAVIRIGNISPSQPRKIYCDDDLRQMVFWPGPDQAYWLDFYYYYQPTLPTDADSTGDALVPLWPFNQELLIKAIQAKALYFDNPVSYKAAEGEIMDELQKVKFNSFNTQGGSNKIKLGKSFRRRY
jgi:hypothetical protein